MSLTLLGVGALGAGAAVALSRNLPDPTKIAPGVRLGDVPIGGLSRDEALERAREWAHGRMNLPIVLKAPVSGKQWTFTVAQVGGRFDLDSAVLKAWEVGKDDNFFEKLYHGSQERNVTVQPSFKIDEAKLDLQLTKIAKEINRPARNARAKMDPKGTLVLAKREEKGLKVDTDATKSTLLQSGVDALARGAESEIVVQEEQPKVTSADLGKLGTLLGSFSTDYSSSPSNRKHNVGLAASKIDGTLLAPGEVFSYNKIVGPRELGQGWRVAHQYQDGLVVDGVGGGVCQVSTTLYNAVLRADLKIVSRSNHSMTVRYVPAGCDATVSYDNTDFKFENSTSGPIFVGAKADGDRLLFRLYGTQPPERKVLDIFTSSRRYAASGNFSVTSYRRIQLGDGTTKTEVIATSTYRPPKEPTAAAPRRTIRRPARPAARPAPPAAPPATTPTTPTGGAGA